MALATRCPSCTTVFRISTAQAAAKAGMVRCGICLHVFNSLDALVRVEDLDVVEEVIVDPTEGTAAFMGAASADAAVDASAPHAGEASAATVDTAAPSPIDTSPSIAPTVRDDQAIVREWWLPEGPLEGVLASGEAPASDAGPAAPRGATAPGLLGRRDDIAPEPSALDVGPATFLQSRETERASRPLRRVLGTLSFVALVALVAQLAYQWRDELAVRWPPSRPWLAVACAPLGCRVGFPAHPDAITIESAGVQAGAPGSYVMTALLRNRDAVDVRYPHLEFVLTDFEDRPIVRRLLRPEDYLPAGRAPDAGFPAASELPVRVAFELDDVRFVGYRLTQTYP